MSAKEITNAYQNLWRIEESFRTIKSFFAIRPMFHWTPARIRGHILLNFISLILEKHLLLQLKATNAEASHGKIRTAVSTTQGSLLKVGKKTVMSYASLDEFQRLILEVLNIRSPKNSFIS